MNREAKTILYGGTAVAAGIGAYPPLHSSITLLGLENDTSFGFLSPKDAIDTFFRYRGDRDFGANFLGIEDGYDRMLVDGAFGIALVLIAILAAMEAIRSLRADK